MTTLLDHLETRPATTITTTPAQRLRATMAAVRVSFRWLGTQKTLSPEQKAQAAETFDAEGQFLSAAKRLLDINPARKRIMLESVLAPQHTRCTCARSSWRFARGVSPVSA